MLTELRLALRLLVKQKGFTCVALLTLALCIGANTAIFSAVYALMLRPLPYPQPDRLVEIYNTYGGNKSASNVTEYLDYKENARSFSDFGLWADYEGSFGDDTSSERAFGAKVTSDFFNVLGLKPLLGQFFAAENSRPNEDKIVVLTQSFWASRFNEDPGVIGKTARIDGETVTIAGIAPRALEAFDARVRWVRPLVWDPANVNPQSRHSNFARLYARLKSGTTLAQAQAEGDTLERRFYAIAAPGLKSVIDRTNARIRMGFVPAERMQPLKSTLLLLQGGVVFVLLIGCVNIANLLLARANGRRTELAVRFSLGASRGAITRQLLLETLLLTSVGTGLGVGLGWCALTTMNHYRALLMPEALPFALNVQVMGVTILVSTVATLAIGLVPVVHVLRANLREMMQGNTRSSSGSAGVRTLSGALVMGQVAVALILLTGAGLLIHSFAKALAVDPGFDPRGVVTGRIAIPRPHRATETTARSLQARVEQAMKEISGVSSVALSQSVPFLGGLGANTLTLADDTRPADAPQPGANRVYVSPEYFETLGLHLIEGRFLERGDLAAGRRSYVVDEDFARKFFPGRSAVGQHFNYGGRPATDADWSTIVGVVRNVPHKGVEERGGLAFTYEVISGRPSGLAVFLRTTQPAGEVVRLLREKLRAIDPAIVLFDAGSLQSFMDGSLNQRRAVMLLLGTFAGVALFLSALGLYGILAYDVAQRRREIGVRGAIGATPFQIVSLVMRQGLWKTGAGLVLGLVGAVWLTRLMKSLLFHLDHTDPWTYVAVSSVLLAVAALASYLPARRAARIDPVEALRTE